MNNKLQPTDAAAALPLEVFDAETGEMVTCTPEEQEEAATIFRMVEMATIAKSVALARIVDRKYYLALGFSSFKDFANGRMPFGYRQAKKYASVGRRFEQLFPEFVLRAGDSKGNPGSLLLPESPNAANLEGVAGLGIRKLYDMTKLDEASFKDVVEHGRLVMPDGSEHTIGDLRDMAADETNEIIAQAQMDKRAYQSRIQQLEEKNRLLESERDAARELVRDAEDRYDEAARLERKWKIRDLNHEEKTNRLTEARRLAVKLREKMLGNGFKLTGEDTDGLKSLLVETLREISAIHYDCEYMHNDAIITAPDGIISEAAYRRMHREHVNPHTGEVVTDADLKDLTQEELDAINEAEGRTDHDTTVARIIEMGKKRFPVNGHTTEDAS